MALTAAAGARGRGGRRFASEAIVYIRYSTYPPCTVAGRVCRKKGAAERLTLQGSEEVQEDEKRVLTRGVIIRV